MHTGNTDRLWLLGGVIGAAVLSALAWFLLIGPQYGDTDTLHEQAATTEARLSTLHHRLAELQTQSGNLPAYRAALEHDQQALPANPALPDFLRELQAAGDGTGVEVTGVAVTRSAQTAAAASAVDALSVSLTASGATGDLDRFLDQLQDTQPRAALIDGVKSSDEDTHGPVTLNVTLRIFASGTGSTGSAAPAPVR